jgi:hypothetical protein
LQCRLRSAGERREHSRGDDPDVQPLSQDGERRFDLIESGVVIEVEKATDLRLAPSQAACEFGLRDFAWLKAGGPAIWAPFATGFGFASR